MNDLLFIGITTVVSIPYRYYKNPEGSTTLPEGFRLFQFLIGTIKTH